MQWKSEILHHGDGAIEISQGVGDEINISRGGW